MKCTPPIKLCIGTPEVPNVYTGVQLVSLTEMLVDRAPVT